MGIEEGKPNVVNDSNDDRLWALMAHLSILVGLGIVAPLVIWLVKKDDSPFVEDQAKEALNFQLAVAIASLVLTATCIGAIVLPVVVVGGIVYGILGGMDAYKGITYRYPYTIRIIK